MKVDILNKENKKGGTIELSNEIFGRPWNPNLVHQVFTSMQSSRRSPLAHAKDRSEVRGGGKKPWRQKGTGRARHGSSRSPIWAGGGVTFGPLKERNFTKKVNKKMRKRALYSTLSRKLKDGEVKILDTFGVTEPKTKQMTEAIKEITKVEKKTRLTTLLVSKQGEKNSILAGRNIEKNKITYPNGVNLRDCITHKLIIFEKEAVEEFINNQTGKKKTKEAKS